MMKCFGRLCGITAALVVVGVSIVYSDTVGTQDKEMNAERFFFSSGGMVNNEYFLQGQSENTIWSFKEENQGKYVVGEPFAIPEEYADRAFKIKKGMYIKTFQDSKPVCVGRIKGFDFIQYEATEGFFIRTECPKDGLMVMADSSKDLKRVIQGKSLTPVNDQQVINSLRTRVFKYYVEKPEELRGLLQGPFSENPRLSDEELLDTLKTTIEMEITAYYRNKPASGDRVFFVTGKEKEPKWGARFLFAFFHDGAMQVLGNSAVLQQITINKMPHFLINYQQQGTGVTVDQVYQLKGAQLVPVFSEGGFSN